MLVKVHAADDLVRLRNIAAHEGDARLRDRHRAVLLALEGHEAPAIAETLGRSRSSVQSWVYAYRDGGLDALRPRPRPGRPCRLTEEQREALARHIDDHNDPVKHPDGSLPVRGRELRDHVAAVFGVRYSLAGAYRLLDRLDFAPLRPRPRHPKNDPAEMEKWRAAAPLLSAT